ncbi:hypothetical protein I5L60_04400 [Pseudomonas putida]|nr:hypothetical protein [Pseudomonas putida]MBH3458991.1 hypothetical protein [Pseudomonas putida]
MLATDSIRNAQGGIIAGREVSLTALTGDVINERSVTRLEGRAGGEQVTKDLVDSAARIEAANDLTVTAGRDIGNVVGVLKAGGSYLGSLIKGEDPTYSLLGAILGGVVGFRTG